MTVQAEITRTGRWRYEIVLHDREHCITYRPYVFGGAWQCRSRKSAERKARRLIREHLADAQRTTESWTVEVGS